MPPTIVLVHGAFAESARWDRVIRRLEDARYDVIAAANALRGLAADAAGGRRSSTPYSQ
jgi:pimeloyl-ACP methyl ester carboxylesterase